MQLETAGWNTGSGRLANDLLGARYASHQMSLMVGISWRAWSAWPGCPVARTRGFIVDGSLILHNALTWTYLTDFRYHIVPPGCAMGAIFIGWVFCVSSSCSSVRIKRRFSSKDLAPCPCHIHLALLLTRRDLQKSCFSAASTNHTLRSPPPSMRFPSPPVKCHGDAAPSGWPIKEPSTPD